MLRNIQKWTPYEMFMVSTAVFDVKYLHVSIEFAANVVKPFLPYRTKDAVRRKIQRILNGK